ncbi:MAG: mucoidy inhibitor MuiA family protein, partial [Armatimonadetes bacterium]|nr:mucoidy inhibitor MuiA family protein [Armatimonadota bacterium]
MRFAFPRLILLLALAGAATAQTQGTISEVRVYRGQALVTRNVAFDAKAGAQELVVSGLPPQVIPETLYATGDDNLVIRAVRLKTTAVQDAPNEDVRKLDEQIKAVNEQLRKTASDLQLVEAQTKYLDKLEAFVAPTAQVELSKGVLNAESLMTLTKFSFEQRQQLATQKLTLEGTQQDSKDQLGVLTRERAKLAGEAQHTARDAVVFLEARKAGAAALDLSYLVGGVFWAPAYIARLNDGHEKLSLEYHGVVLQMSGEDWPDVALTLSTSSPTTVADPPVLAPLYIALAATEQMEQADKAEAAKDYALRRRALEEQIRQAPAQSRANAPRGAAGERGAPGERGPAGMAGPAGKDAVPSSEWDQRAERAARAGLPVLGDSEGLLEANVLAAQLQNLELSASDEALRTAKRMGSDSSGLTADYAMPGKVTLQSRADPQMLRIATLDLDATFYYTAVPLLSDYIYQAVEAVNNTDYPLLPGPYNA